MRLSLFLALLLACNSSSKDAEDSGVGSGAASGTAAGTGGAGTLGGTATGAGTAAGTMSGSTGTGTSTGGPDPCVVSIPSDAVVVDSTIGNTTSNQTFWICRQDVLSHSAAGSTIFVEDQADAVINGENNTIYVQSRGDIALFQGYNTIIFETGAAIDDQANGNTFTECPELTFDLSNAPSPGC